jgi:two-component system, response regulator
MLHDLSKLPTILLVEDNIDDYDATIRSFKAAHLHNPIHWCKTGTEALDYLKHEGTYAQGPAGTMPALVLLDLNMPGLDGKKVLAAAKQDIMLKKIPIIILTTSSDDRDVTQCYELGASTYIQKPVDFDRLITAVGRIKDYWFGVALLPGIQE